MILFRGDIFTDETSNHYYEIKAINGDVFYIYVLNPHLYFESWYDNEKTKTNLQETNMNIIKNLTSFKFIKRPFIEKIDYLIKTT